MNISKYSIVASVAIMLFSGCGGGGGGESKQVAVEDTKNLFDLFGRGVGINPVVGRAIFNHKSLPGTTSTHYKINSLIANACKGTATYNPSDFTVDGNKTQEVVFSMVFGKFEKCITDKVVFNYSILHEGGTFDFTKEVLNPAYNQSNVYRQAGSDPLYQYQWHLKNNGQRTGVSTPAVAGNDINVENVWDSGITGKGVTVAVIDTGVDMFHPDLKENLLMDLSHNYHTGNLVGQGGINNTTPHRYRIVLDDPNTPPIDEVTGGYRSQDWHGTAVAGLIAAKGWNGIGTRGVSPNAKLVSFNALETWVGKTDSEVKQLFEAGKIPYLYHANQLTHYRLVNSLTAHIDKIDIYNNSWGNPYRTLDYDLGSVNYEDTFKYGVVHGRKGKGAIYVKSAGNGGWTNLEPMQTNGYSILVGASNADGVASSYSSRGPNILINAPGGASQSDYVKPDFHEIVTTDMAGKERGYDSNIPYLSSTQHFNVKGNENYDYTQLMNGTSAAAPIVSGVVALMLEANPNLTWRDVRYILAKTATRNDPTSTTWHRNGAGYWYSYAYGFGRVNAARAVEWAKGFASLGNLYDMKSVSGVASGGKSNNGAISNRATVEKDIAIEHVKVSLSLDLNSSIEYETHSFSGTSSTTTRPFTLYKGDSLISFASRFASDGNDTQASAKLIPIAAIVGDEDAQDIGTITFKEQDRKNKKITLSSNGQYAIKVDTNASSWTIDVKTPLPHTEASQIKIALTSPSGTKTLLVAAPNDLNDTAEDYRNVTLSSVEFLDENSKGAWTLEVSDTNWSSTYNTTYNLLGWSLDITGR